MIELKVGQRVRWKWPEPGVDDDELNGKITSIMSDGDVMVRFDRGYEEACEAADLEVIGNDS